MSSKDINARLMSAKATIEAMQRNRARLEGQLESASKTLRDEFGCADINEAKKLLAKRERELATITKELEAGVAKLEEQIAELENA